MRKAWTQLAVAIWCLLPITAATPALAQGLQADQVVEQARKAYYSLEDAGMKGFRCDVSVDWGGLVAAQIPEENARASTLALLRGGQFELAVGPTGVTEISRHFDRAVPNDPAAGAFRQVVDGAEQTLVSAFQQLTAFLFGPPLPPEGMRYKVEWQGTAYRITSGVEPTVVVETLKQDLSLQEIIVATQDSTVTIHPLLKRGEKGYIPLEIEGKVEAAHADPIALRVVVDYQNVQGLELPQTITAQIQQAGANRQARFTLGNCQIAN